MLKFTYTVGAKEVVIPTNGGLFGHLVVLQGPGLGDFYFLNGKEEFVLGSDPFLADAVVRDVEVAPKHASIIREPGSGAYAVRDLGVGKGGTAVNGELLRGSEHRSLRDGDRIFYSAIPCWSSRETIP